MNKYVEYVQQVVASLKKGETGEPIHKRKWDSIVMDLPIVNQKQQRRPSLKANPNRWKRYGFCTVIAHRKPEPERLLRAQAT